ncbi:MAG: hypothetical protein BGO12_12375 [Verrucomicrobia bacterium 61-8]|nr:MAG: hypothetical protein BGO12_12375 [Verrucomicrobia bacterium 61-8]
MGTADPWPHLRTHTAARIALGRAGASLPTAPLLDFKLAHARAKDAVLTHFDPEQLAAQLRPLDPGLLIVESEAHDRTTYLQRPDYGRRLSTESAELLSSRAMMPGPDLVILVSDGLSTTAVMTQALPVLAALLPMFRDAGWTLAPLLVVKHGRVAIQDQAGALLHAGLSLILLGERPGLGSPDSLGAYFTYNPVPGRSDAERNCVSNIRPQGLDPALAARKLFHLLSASRHLKLSGVNLKDDEPLLGTGFVSEIS